MKITDLSIGEKNMISAGIRELQTISYLNSQSKGFWDTWDHVFQNKSNIPPEIRDSILSAISAQKLALIHSEASELLEGMRKPRPDEHCPTYSSEEIEAADLIIRLLDLAEKRQWNIPGALFDKMTYNDSRPAMHGKAF